MVDPLELPWLRPGPGDFRARIRQLRKADTVSTSELAGLTNHALDLSRLGQISKLVSGHRDALTQKGLLRPVRLAIAASHTVDLLLEALPATGLRHGLLIESHKSDYGQAAQQVLDPASDLAKWQPDFTFLAFDAQALGLSAPILEEATADQAVDTALDLMRSLMRAARENLGTAVIVQTLALPTEATFGNFDVRNPGTMRSLLDRFNKRLIAEVMENGDLLLDTSSIAQDVGLSRWHDPLRWHDAKLSTALDAVPLFADHVCRLLAAALGLARKALVLDLDNTLWGGVIGDDGLEGIKLGQGSAAGEAHLAVQAYARSLRERGIVLAVCSKNEEEAARIPFREHPEMLLKEDDIAVFVANWTDKATNLKFIAEALNIGTDALVFLDDNPAERERVRQELPEVAVPEIGDEPAYYVPILSRAGYFEAVAFGDEDRGRAQMYQANARRASEMLAIGNLDDYLASLDMTCSIRPFDEMGRTRIAQLTNKSNQFNLTTRRRSEAEIAEVEADACKFAVQVRLVDRFGDNGMISVVIFDRGAEEWTCDTWLMSCRVLGRRVEEAVLAHIAAAATKAGAKRLIGQYLPTAKNVIVSDHFAKLGFTQDGELDDGGTRWVLDLGEFSPTTLPMQVDLATDLEASHA